MFLKTSVDFQLNTSHYFPKDRILYLTKVKRKVCLKFSFYYSLISRNLFFLEIRASRR
jgi:hypothetical protein